MRDPTVRHCRRRRKTAGVEKLISRGSSRRSRVRGRSGEKFVFRFCRNRGSCSYPASARGAYARSSRYARRGCGGRVGSQRDLIMPTNDIDTDVKSCGPGLPVLRSSRSQRSRVAPTTGAIEPVPGEITYKRENRRAGNAGCSADPVVTAACVLCCRRAMGEAITRHSLRPLDLSKGMSITALGRNSPRECRRASAI